MPAFSDGNGGLYLPTYYRVDTGDSSWVDVIHLEKSGYAIRLTGVSMQESNSVNSAAFVGGSLYLQIDSNPEYHGSFSNSWIVRVPIE